MLLRILDLVFTVSGIGVLLSIIAFILMMSLPQLGRAELRSLLANDIECITSDMAFNRNLLEKRLKNFAFIAGRNSHPLERFDVVIKMKGGDISLQFARDSEEQNTYWVYYPEYRFFTINEVGKVRL